MSNVFTRAQRTAVSRRVSAGRWIAGAALIWLGAMAAAQAEPIRFAVAAEPYPPFAVKQADGQWAGFEIDLIHSLCAQMKAECKIDEVAWDGIIPSLLGDKVDVIFASMSITAEREKQIAFSHAYYDTPVAVAGVAGTKLDISPTGLKGKAVGVQISTVSANFLKEHYEKIADIRYYDTQDSANADLVSGRIDLMLADGTAVSDFVKSPDAKAANIVNLGTVPHDPLFGQGVGAGLRQQDTALKARLDKAIDTLLASDDYTRLEKKYFDIDVHPKAGE